MLGLDLTIFSSPATTFLNLSQLTLQVDTNVNIPICYRNKISKLRMCLLRTFFYTCKQKTSMIKVTTYLYQNTLQK